MRHRLSHTALTFQLLLATHGCQDERRVSPPTFPSRRGARKGTAQKKIELSFEAAKQEIRMQITFRQETKFLIA
jgi:hypothetical protein